MPRRRLVPWIAIVAFLTSIAYAVSPGPYTIAAFALVGIPLYGVVIIAYIAIVVQDLRGRQVL